MLKDKFSSTGNSDCDTDAPADEMLGTRIKINRIRKKFDQKELADKVDISVNYLSQIESNKKVPSLKCLFRLANALEINPIILTQEDPLFKQMAAVFKEQESNADQLFGECDDVHTESPQCPSKQE